MAKTSRAVCDGMYLVSRGSGDPVLFLHGIPTSCQLWNGVIERMSDGFRCMAVDLPGLGHTSRAERGFGELGALVGEIEELRIRCGVERWHVVGHDAGCAIAVQYAHRHPERVGRLALLTPSMFPDLEPFFLFELLRKPVLGEILAPLVGLVFWRLVMRRAFGGAAELDAAIEDFHAPFAGARGAWRLMSVLRWGKPEEVLASIPEVLPQLTMPTMIFHGARDRAVPERFATRAVRLMPHAEKVVVDSGHFLPMSDPGVVAGRLRVFFEGGMLVEETELIEALTAAD